MCAGDGGMMRYQSLRSERLRLVVDTLQRHRLSGALRGSWKYDDFHLAPTGALTRSDLDLVVDGLTPAERLQTQVALQADFGSSMALRVSVHGADSLLKMNLADSFILNIGEFISKTQKLKAGDPDYDYTLAKITLLLLRSFPEERYAAVAARIATPEVQLALGVKLGLESAFSPKKSAMLLHSNASPIVREFIDAYVLAVPSPAFVDTIRNRVRRCQSIDLWLQEYLISKMGGTAT